MTSKKNWDAAGFWAALNRCIEARGVDLKSVSDSTGVSQSTLSRMKNEGRHPDAASLAALSAWSGINPAEYVRAEPVQPTVKFSPDALASAIREMVSAEVQGDGERYTMNETIMRDQLHALARKIGQA